MRKKNIEFLLEMTKSYLIGNIDIISYGLDFPYEVEKRYKDLVKEDRKLAEAIYDCLVEDGAHLYDVLTEYKFKKKIAEHYKYINGICNGEVHII
ncbi:MAG: hypothetical protein WC983_10275 [Tissierellaceae bacterium]